MWLTAAQALERLGTKPQSLYASVSRGRVAAKPDPADSRRSLYREEDIDRLAHRARGRGRTGAVAAEAMNWGEPVLPSAISTMAGGRLFYRGQDAVKLAAKATLEDIAKLLWALPGAPLLEAERLPVSPSMHRLFSALAERAATDPPSLGRGRVLLLRDATGLLSLVANQLTSPGDTPIHVRLAARWDRPAAADSLRRALVLLADHELNVSTFAARVTVSAGASLAAGMLAGLCALSGPLHGDAAAPIMALAADVADDSQGAEHALREWVGEGRTIPGFGHRLYPRGDVRASALLANLELPKSYNTFRSAAENLSGELPNVDFALAALASTYGLPREAPRSLFALARSVGWLAHMIEQVTSGTLIRPRAHYVGPAVRPS
ncbi:citrate synthase [Devosia sp.]|uniref:citrate synthase n=1 Tax=Devosia sp. TaxID=1871048 RepID=UPI003BAB2156